MRLIDADALPRHGGRGGIVHWKDIEGSPAIILEKRGRWIEDGHYERCSECGEYADELHNYCPNCGARMEEEK